MSLPRRLAGWLQAAHPFPLCVVLTLTAVVGLISAGGSPEVGRLALLLLAMLLSQLCIGWTNDYRDRDLDARYQPAKPVPSGVVRPNHLRLAASAVGVASLSVGVALGVVPWLLLAAGTAAGLAYDFGVKRTKLSWLPYVVALAVLPPYVWTALRLYRSDFAWLYLVASPLTVAAHLANALPDLEADAAAGTGGIVVTLGRRNALALLAGCLALPPALVGLTSLWLTYDSKLIVVLGVYAACSLVAVPLLASRGRQARVVGFRLALAAAVLFTCGWLASV